MRRWAVATALGVGLSVGATPGAGFRGEETSRSEPKRQPNVLLILVDDLGAPDLPLHGSKTHVTPNLDRFAERARVFDQAYSASPVCSPSRAALLTGKDPVRIGITNYIPGDFPSDRPLVEPPIHKALPLEEVTLAERFRAAGYVTMLSGKWHLGEGRFGPEQQGFEINLGGGRHGQPPSYYSPYKLPTLPDGPVGEYLTDRQASDTIDFIAKNRSRPFFAMLSFYTVHTPLVPAPGGLAAEKARIATLPQGPAYEREGRGFTKLRQDNATYASMVRSMDAAVGRVLDALAREGVADNTIVIFTSDNGGLSTLDPTHAGGPRPNTPTASRPLRAGKGWLYEGGIRVPLIMRGPGIPDGRSPEPVSLLDMVPTLARMARLPAPAPGEIDGRSLSFGAAGAKVDRPLFWHFPHYHGSAMTPGSAVRLGRWKLIRHYEGSRDELFDLVSDPKERIDLAARRPEIARRMAGHLDRWIARIQAPLPKKRTP